MRRARSSLGWQESSARLRPGRRLEELTLNLPQVVMLEGAGEVVQEGAGGSVDARRPLGSPGQLSTEKGWAAGGSQPRPGGLAVTSSRGSFGKSASVGCWRPDLAPERPPWPSIRKCHSALAVLFCQL